VYHIFMIYLSLLCGRPEVLQGYALTYPGMINAPAL